MEIQIDLPDDLAARFEATVPPWQRSRFITDLLEKALPETDEALYRLALEVEQDTSLNEDMADWDVTVADGLESRQ
jgi:hypothetical protein